MCRVVSRHQSNCMHRVFFHGAICCHTLFVAIRTVHAVYTSCLHVPCMQHVYTSCVHVPVMHQFLFLESWGQQLVRLESLQVSSNWCCRPDNSV